MLLHTQRGRVSLTPEHQNSLDLAVALHKQGRLLEAQEYYKSILNSDPTNCNCLHLLGVIAGQQRKTEEAVRLITAAININPSNAIFFRDRAVALFSQRRFADALADCERAIANDPEYIDAHVYRGVVLSALNRHYCALESHDAAVSIAPNNAIAHMSRANTLRALGLHLEAVAAYDRAIALQPGLVEAYSNRGVALKEMGRVDDALMNYDEAILLNPNYAEAHAFKSTALLLKGELRAGWQAYEWRWKKESNLDRALQISSPAWRGDSDIRAKTILLHSEQGYGDTIQFGRYAKLVSERGATVILEAPRALHTLFQSLDGVDRIVGRGDQIPRCDFHCPLMSLPMALDTTLDTIPAQIPYLHVNNETARVWSEKVGPKRRLRVGVAWKGSPAHPNDKNRSIRIEQFLTGLPQGLEYYSLQIEPKDGDAREVAAASPTIVQFKDIGDFSETAALCNLMDIVVTVDTSVAHLSGALGKRTWVLLPFIPDWRWMLGRSDSPWYPSMRLFRQTAAGNWLSVLEEVRRELEVFV